MPFPAVRGREPYEARCSTRVPRQPVLDAAERIAAETGKPRGMILREWLYVGREHIRPHLVSVARGDLVTVAMGFTFMRELEALAAEYGASRAGLVSACIYQGFLRRD